MGIVKISDLLHDDIRDASKAMSRSVNAQAEYWIRLGMMSELYPELNHQQIKLLMLKSGSDRLLEVINAINIIKTADELARQRHAGQLLASVFDMLDTFYRSRRNDDGD
ncbi:methionine aminopeptidase [Klebsiella pneumoniae]|nr:methionine aminopeptidase [Klebsiella pneumoniae]